ncbi:MAG: ABC transporter permease subunit, partial [Mesorhizobium sp.]|nr:ABC transporter permease subunit [Mesorhizobium sp.]
MPAIARASRAVTLDVAHKEFVQYAEAIGMPRRQILMREILPNILTPLMVEAGFRLTWAMGLIAGINFLGFGVQPPTADWGMMINENRDGLLFQPWAVGLPIICIGFVIFGANLLADAVARAAARIEG